MRQGSGATGEAANVAVAVATRGVFGDPFAVAQGPTAHLLPTTPLFAGITYALLGVRTPLAESALTFWSVALVLGSFLIFMRTFGRLGTPRSALLAALTLLATVPVYLGQEAVDFRVWEGGLAVFLASVFAYLVVQTDQLQVIAVRRIILISAAAAALFFVSPPMGVGAIMCCLILAWRRYNPQQWLVGGLAGLLILATLITPWSLRNQRELGYPILLRSNAGLELALANHDAAVRGTDPLSTFESRLREIHPAESRVAYDTMVRTGGEVTYSRLLGKHASGWIKANLADFARLSVRHWAEFYMPRPWQFRVSGSNNFPEFRSAWASAVGLLGLVGAIVAVVSRKRAWTYLAILVLVPGVLIMPFQPVPRYTYLNYAILTFFALDLLWRLVPRHSRSALESRHEAHRADSMLQ